MKFLVDTNVLLRTRDAENPTHAECVQAIDVLEQHGCYPYICTQVLAEYWVVATRPSDVNGMGLSVKLAIQELLRIRNAFPCLLETSDTVTAWVQLITDHNVMGRQAHDARIAALMLSNGITHLLTLNPSDFKRYSELTVITPFELIANPNLLNG